MIVSIGVVRAFELHLLKATSTASTFVAFVAGSSSFVEVAFASAELHRPCSDCNHRPLTAREAA